MSGEAGKGEGGKGDAAGKGEGGKGPESQKTSFLKSKWFLILLLIAACWAAYYFLFPGKNGEPDRSADDDKVLGLYDPKESAPERKNIVDLYHKSLEFAQFEVETFLIELEKLQRTKELDIRLAGRKAMFYAQDKGEEQKQIETEKNQAEKKERARIESEEKRLKSLLDEAIEDVKRLKKKLRDARIENVQRKDEDGGGSKK